MGEGTMTHTMANGIVQGSTEDKMRWRTCTYCNMTGPLVGQTVSGDARCFASCTGEHFKPKCKQCFDTWEAQSEGGICIVCQAYNAKEGLIRGFKPSLLQIHEEEPSTCRHVNVANVPKGHNHDGSGEAFDMCLDCGTEWSDRDAAT